MDFVAQQLLADGVRKFKEDYERLLNNLVEKRDRILEGTSMSEG